MEAYVEAVAPLGHSFSAGMAVRRQNGSHSLLEKKGIVPFFVHESSWREEARGLNVILWPVVSLPWEIEEAREKIFFLEKVMGKRVSPDFTRIMLFRNFPCQYMSLKAHGIPMVSVFISYDYDDALRYAEKAKAPLLFRSEQGSQAAREELLLTPREMKKKISHAFRLGVPGRWPGHRDKQHVILMSAPEEDDLRGTFWCAGLYGFFGHGSCPQEEEEGLARKLWGLACRVRTVQGFQDCILEFRYSLKNRELLLETAHPLFPGLACSVPSEACFFFHDGSGIPERTVDPPHMEKILMGRLYQAE